MRKRFFVPRSKFAPRGRVGAVILTAGFSLTLLQTPACAEEPVRLRAQTAQADQAPAASPATQPSPSSDAAAVPNPHASAPSDSAASTDEPPKQVHKLQASKQELMDEHNSDGEPNPRNDIDSTIDARSFNLNGATNAPAILPQSLFGERTGAHELFAERDSGYGVCGFVMNVPLHRGYVTIRKVFPTMPADRAKLQPGDLIVAVNGISTLEIPVAQVWDYFTGMPGTDVQLDMLRGDHPFSVTLKRMDIGHIPDQQIRTAFLTIYQMRGASHFLQN
jgi:C-terminal processing protease CtpA/Prc